MIRLDSTIGECNVDRITETLGSCFAVANSEHDNCASGNNTDNTDRLEGWLSPV